PRPGSPSPGTARPTAAAGPSAPVRRAPGRAAPARSPAPPGWPARPGHRRSCGQDLDELVAVVVEALGVGRVLTGPEEAVAGAAEPQAPPAPVLLDPGRERQG